MTFFTGLLFSSCNKNIAARKMEKIYYYNCMMHPDYIAYQPGKCPKCGMTLEAWDMKDMPHNKSGNSHIDHFNSGGHSGGHH